MIQISLPKTVCKDYIYDERTNKDWGENCRHCLYVNKCQRPEKKYIAVPRTDIHGAPIYTGDIIVVDGVYISKVDWVPEVKGLGIYGVDAFKWIMIIKGTDQDYRKDGPEFD